MQPVLIIDTSFSQSILAIGTKDTVWDQFVLTGSVRENDNIVFHIARLLEKNTLTLEMIQGIGVSIGPGSYTGLRLSIAAVKGFALALNCPIKAFSVFDIFAHHLLMSSAQKLFSKEALIVVDTQRGEYFCQKYSAAGIKENAPFFLQEEAIEKYRNENPDVIIAGQRIPTHSLDAEFRFPDAATMLDLYFHTDQKPISIEALEPIYMRQADFVKLKEFQK